MDPKHKVNSEIVIVEYGYIDKTLDANFGTRGKIVEKVNEDTYTIHLYDCDLNETNKYINLKDFEFRVLFDDDYKFVPSPKISSPSFKIKYRSVIQSGQRIRGETGYFEMLLKDERDSSYFGREIDRGDHYCSVTGSNMVEKGLGWFNILNIHTWFKKLATSLLELEEKNEAYIYDLNDLSEKFKLEKDSGIINFYLISEQSRLIDNSSSPKYSINFYDYRNEIEKSLCEYISDLKVLNSANSDSVSKSIIKELEVLQKALSPQTLK